MGLKCSLNSQGCIHLSSVFVVFLGQMNAANSYLASLCKPVEFTYELFMTCQSNLYSKYQYFYREGACLQTTFVHHFLLSIISIVSSCKKSSHQLATYITQCVYIAYFSGYGDRQVIKRYLHFLYFPACCYWSLYFSCFFHPMTADLF